MNAFGEANALLGAAIEDEDSDTVLRLIRGGEFTLFEIEEESDDEESAAMTAECDGRMMLVAFSSREAATTFANVMSEEFGDEEITGLDIDGENLLVNLPEGLGILLDPESDGCYEIPVELLE